MINFIVKILNKIKSFVAKLKIDKFGKNSIVHCLVFKRDKSSKIFIGNNCLINGRLVTEYKDSEIEIKNNVFIGEILF